MIQINLLGKKRKESSKRSWIVVGAMVAFVAFVLYFLGATLYIVIRLSLINGEISRVDREAEEISARISANKETLTRYVLSKYILDKVGSLKKDRFRYKDYLDQIVRLMPVNAVLTSVDFTNKGQIAVSVSLPGVNSVKEIENNLSSGGILSQSEFSSVFVESVSSDKSGIYNAKLYFEVKRNGG